MNNLLKYLNDQFGEKITTLILFFIVYLFTVNIPDWDLKINILGHRSIVTHSILIPYLLKKGGVVKYYDPSGPKSEFKKNKNLKFEKNLSKACLGADLIIINTEWDEFKSIDFKKMVRKSNFKVYDMRNLYNSSELKKRNVNYYSIGR